ncbi:MAG: succinate--CoA ligase subunit alpha [Dehalococcoidales bacterium]|nr:succinate--CoA ligase subunit alpha [Dehalococcoidales bacterium]
MSVIINKDSRVIVQGITGNEGRFHTASMLGYGTKVVAGVTPGKGGQQIEGVPVYNTVAEAVTGHGADTSIIFVPAPFARSAALEAIDAGIKTMVIISEGIPQKDAIEFINRARKKDGTVIIGPNCPGIINPSLRIKVGIMPDRIFRPGNVGIISRSGTLTYEIAWHISRAGMGQSTCIGMGGDPVVGLDFISLLESFKSDPESESVVLIGEIGGNAEEMAAEYIRETNYPKRVVAYIAGRVAPPGKRMGHAGAIVMGSAGTARSKIDAFTRAKVPVAEKPSDIVKLLVDG